MAIIFEGKLANILIRIEGDRKLAGRIKHCKRVDHVTIGRYERKHGHLVCLWVVSDRILLTFKGRWSNAFWIATVLYDCDCERQCGFGHVHRIDGEVNSIE